MVENYAANLRRLRGLRFDSGYEDEFTHIPPTARAFSEALTARGIDHVFEEFNGDHRNRMMGRTGRLANEVLPYFGCYLIRRARGELCDLQGQSRRFGRVLIVVVAVEPSLTVGLLPRGHDAKATWRQRCLGHELKDARATRAGAVADC